MKKILLAVVLLFGIVNADVAIISNKSTNVSIQNSNAAYDIFAMTKGNYKIFYLKSSPINDEFYSFLGKSFNDMKKTWMRLQLTEGKTAVAVNSEEEMLEKVSSTSNSIGYVSAQKVNGSVKLVYAIK
jgi:hypothetical protein